MDIYPGAPGKSGSTDNLQGVLGIGAFSTAQANGGSTGGGNFGQAITEQFVRSFISTTAMNMGAGDGSLADITENLANYLSQLELSSLKWLQPYIPGATDDDFSTTAGAVDKIMEALNLQLLMGVQDFTNWLTSIFDPKSALWNDAKAKWDAVVAALSGYPPFGSSAATVAVWWSNLFVAIGFDSMTAATIANIISGNYDWAKQSKSWLDQILASLGLSNGTQVGSAISANTSNISTQNNWLTQISQIVNGQFVTPINTAVQQFKDWWAANTTQVSGNSSSIATQLAWWQRQAENALIDMDSLHIFYPLGSPSDGPTTTSLAYGAPARRTWYAMQADRKLLQTQVTTTPGPAPGTISDIGSATQAAAAAASLASSNAAAAAAANQDLTNKIIGSQTGVEPTNGTTTQAATALQNIPASNIAGQTGAVVQFGGSVAGNNGNAGNVNFTYTPQPTDTMLTVQMTTTQAYNGTSYSSSVTANGGAMTLVKRITSSNYGASLYNLEVWSIPITPSSSPAAITVVANASYVASGGATANSSITVGASSFFGSKFVQKIANSGGISSSAALVQSGSSTTDRRFLVVWAVGGSSKATWSGASGYTERRAIGPAGYNGLEWGDAAGTGAAQNFSVNHGMTGGPAGQWMCMLIEISN